jgi:transposase-like protein
VTKFDDQILLLYAKGMTTRDIAKPLPSCMVPTFRPPRVLATDVVLDKGRMADTPWTPYPILYLIALVKP